jgi:hypothetical protein
MSGVVLVLVLVWWWWWCGMARVAVTIGVVV